MSSMPFPICRQKSSVFDCCAASCDCHLCGAGEEGKQASFTWLMQKWRVLGSPGNVWAPSIVANAAAQHEEAVAATAAAKAAAAAARAVSAAAPAEAAAAEEDPSEMVEVAHVAAPRRPKHVVKKKTKPATSSVSLRDAVAAAGHVSPPWKLYCVSLLLGITASSSNMCCAIYSTQGCCTFPSTSALLWGVVHCLNVSRHLPLAKVSVKFKSVPIG